MNERSAAGRSGEQRLLAAGLAAFAALHLATGVFMVAAPGTFFEEVGPFGVQNDHYIRDLSTYYLAVGAALAIAVRIPSWRVPVLVLVLIEFALHSVNHLIDIDEAEPSSVGVVDFVSLVAGTALLAWLLRLALRSARRGAAASARQRGRR